MLTADQCKLAAQAISDLRWIIAATLSSAKIDHSKESKARMRELELLRAEIEAEGMATNYQTELESTILAVQGAIGADAMKVIPKDFLINEIKMLRNRANNHKDMIDCVHNSAITDAVRAVQDRAVGDGMFVADVIDAIESLKRK